MALIIQSHPGGLWAIRATHYSKALRAACRMIPGMRFEPPLWVGYVDAVRTVKEYLEAQGLRLQGEPLPNPGVPKDVTLGLLVPAYKDLRPYQVEGVQFLITQAETGVLLADDLGLGKSCQALRVARAFKQPTLIVCPRFARSVWDDGPDSQVKKWWPDAWPPLVLEGVQPERAKGRLKSFVDGELSPDGVTPLVTVCHYDILYAWADLLIKRGVKFLILDEARYLQSEKSRRSLAARQIAEQAPYRVGLDGTPVSNHTSDLWNVLDTLSPKRWGKPFAFYLRYCCKSNTPVWMADYSLKSIGGVKVGDRVVGWGTNSQPKRWRKGTPKHKRQWLKVGIVTNVIRRRAPCIKVQFESGATVICTPDHLWRHYHRCQTHGVYEFGAPKLGMIVQSVIDISPDPEPTQEYRLGYVLGALAGDGTIHQSRYSTGGIRNTNVNLRVKHKAFADRFNEYAQAVGFKTSRGRASDKKLSYQLYRVSLLGGDCTFRKIRPPHTKEEWRGWLAGIYDAEGHMESISQYKRVNPSTYRLICRGLSLFGFKFKQDPEAIRVLGGHREYVRLWRTLRPVLQYKIDKRVLAAAFGQPDRIVSIRRCGDHEVVSLTTTTGNYIAGGYASKNCGAHQEQVTPTKLVWKFDGLSNENELYNRLRYMMLQRTKSDVQMQLPPRIRQVLDLEVEDKFCMGADVALRSDVSLRQALNLSADGKFPQIIEKCLGLLAEGRNLVVFTHRRKVCEAFADALGGDFTVGMIHGEVPHKKRDAIIREHPQCLVCNMDCVAGGIDLSFYDVDLFAELDYNPQKMIQCSGRLHRFGQKKTVHEFFCIGRGTIDELIRDRFIRKLEMFEKTVGKTDDRMKEDLDASAHEVGVADLRRFWETMQVKKENGDD